MYTCILLIAVYNFISWSLLSFYFLGSCRGILIFFFSSKHFKSFKPKTVGAVSIKLSPDQAVALQVFP